MGGTVSLEQLAHDSLGKSDDNSWKEAVQEFIRVVPLDPAPDAFPKMKVNAKTYNLMMSHIDKEIQNPTDGLIPMLQVLQRLLSMERFYRCLRTPLPQSMIDLLSEKDPKHPQATDAKEYIIDILLRISFSRIKFAVVGCCAPSLAPSDEVVIQKLETVAKNSLLSVNAYQHLLFLCSSIKPSLQFESIENRLVASALQVMHCSLLERSCTTSYTLAKNIVNSCLEPAALNTILNLSISQDPVIRLNAALLLKGLILHSPIKNIRRIQEAALHGGFLLWYMYFCINKSKFAQEHLTWQDDASMNCFRDFLGYLVDGHKDIATVLNHTLPADLAIVATRDQLASDKSIRQPVNITDTYSFEASKNDLAEINVIGWNLYRTGMIKRTLWAPVFELVDQNHAAPTLIWDEYTRQELIDGIVLEIEELKLQRAVAHGKEFKEFKDSTVDQTSIPWDHIGYSVQYESLNRHLRVQDYYVYILLPILEKASEHQLKTELIKQKSVQSPNEEKDKKGKSEKKGKTMRAIQDFTGRLSGIGFGTEQNEDVNVDVELTLRTSYQAGRTSQLAYHIPPEKLSGLVFACFQKAVIEDDVGWKLACLRLMSALFETHKEILQDADMIPYLIWLLAPKPTGDGSLPEDVIRFLERFQSKDASGGPMDEITMQQIQKIAINNPLWRDHILRFLDQLFTYNSNITSFVSSDGISTLVYYINQIHLVNEMASPSPRHNREKSGTQESFAAEKHQEGVEKFSQAPVKPPTPRPAIPARTFLLNQTGGGKARIIHKHTESGGSIQLLQLFDMDVIRHRQSEIVSLPRDNMLENVHGPEDNAAVARRALRLLSKIVLNAPRLRRTIFRDSLLVSLVQLMLCDDDVIIAESLMVLDHLLEANTHAIPDLAGTGFFLFGLYAMRQRSMSCMGVFMDNYHLMQSTQYAAADKTVLAPFFPPPMVAIIEERGVAEAFKLLDGESFSPTIIWDLSTRKALFKVVTETTHKFLVELCQEPSLAYVYQPPPVIQYPTIEKELYVGSVYVRLFNATPTVALKDPIGFMKALIEETANEKYAFLFEEDKTEHASKATPSSSVTVEVIPSTTVAPRLAVPPPASRSNQYASGHNVANTSLTSQTPPYAASTPLTVSKPAPVVPGLVAQRASQYTQYLDVLQTRTRLSGNVEKTAYKTLENKTHAKVNRIESRGNNAQHNPPKSGSNKKVRMSVMGDADVNEIMLMDDITLLTYNLMLLIRAQHIMICKIEEFEVLKRYGAIQQILSILATTCVPFTHENDLFRLGIRLLRCVLVVPNSSNAKVCVQKGGIPLVLRLITELGDNIRASILNISSEDATKLASYIVDTDTAHIGASIIASRPGEGETIEMHCLRENVDLLAQLFISLNLLLRANSSGQAAATSPTSASTAASSTSSDEPKTCDTPTSASTSSLATTPSSTFCAEMETISILIPYISVCLRLNVAIAAPALPTAVLAVLSTLLRNNPRIVSYLLKHGVILDCLDLAINDIQPHKAPVVVPVSTNPSPPTYSRTAVINSLNTSVRSAAVSLLASLVDRTRMLDPFYATFERIVSQCLSPGLLQELYRGYDVFVQAIQVETRSPTLIWGPEVCAELNTFLLEEIQSRNVARDNVWKWGLSAHDACVSQASALAVSMDSIPAFPFIISPQRNYCVVKDVYLELYKTAAETYSLPPYVDSSAFFDELCSHCSSICRTPPPEDSINLAEHNISLMLAAGSIVRLVRAHPELVSPALDNPYSELRRLLSLLLSNNPVYESSLLQVFSKFLEDIRIHNQESSPQAVQSVNKMVLFAAHDLHYILSRTRATCEDGPSISFVLNLIDTLISIEVSNGRMALLQRFWENGLLISLVYIIANPFPVTVEAALPASRSASTSSSGTIGNRFGGSVSAKSSLSMREIVQNTQAHHAAVARVSMSQNATLKPGLKKTTCPPMPAFSEDIRKQAVSLLGRLCTLSNAGDYFMHSTKALFAPQFAASLLSAQASPDIFLQKFEMNAEEPEFFWNEACRKDLRDFVSEEIKLMQAHHLSTSQEYSLNMFQLRLEDEGYCIDDYIMSSNDFSKSGNFSAAAALKERQKELPIPYEVMLIGDTEHYPRYPHDPNTWKDRFLQNTLSQQINVDGVYVNVLHQNPNHEFKVVQIQQFYVSLLTAIKAEMELYMWFHFTLEDAIALIEDANAADMPSTSGFSQSYSLSQSQSISIVPASSAAPASSLSIEDDTLDEDERKDVPTEQDLVQLYRHSAGSYEKLCVLLETLEHLSLRDEKLPIEYMKNDVISCHADFVRCESVIENNPALMEDSYVPFHKWLPFLNDGNKLTVMILRLLVIVAKSSRAEDFIKHRTARYLLPLLFTYFDFSTVMNETVLGLVLQIILTIFEHTKSPGAFADQLHSLGASLFLLSIIFQDDHASRDLQLQAARVIGNMCSPDSIEGVEARVHFLRFLTTDFEPLLADAANQPEHFLEKIQEEHKCSKLNRQWNHSKKIDILTTVIQHAFVDGALDRELIPTILDWDLGSGRVFDIQSMASVWRDSDDDYFVKYIAEWKESKRQKENRSTEVSLDASQMDGEGEVVKSNSSQDPESEPVATSGVFVSESPSGSVAEGV